MNVDFADVRKIMSARGMAMMGAGTGKGENRAADAAKAALSCPLLEDINLTGARGLLINVTASDTLSMEEFDLINRMITEIAAEDAEVKPGHVLNHDVGEEVRVTVVATGLGRSKVTQIPKTPKARDGKPDWSELERPAWVRDPAHQKQVVAAAGGGATHGSAALDLEYLDIPAFLRNQAD
jgi:cell division protein FtsZ